MCHTPDISTIYRSKTDISAIYQSSPISRRTSSISDISEIYRRIYRIFSSLVKTRRTMFFVYGFMFDFVIFTIFLAFNPSNASSPWFTNIFTTHIGSDSSFSSNDSYISQFSFSSYDFYESHQNSDDFVALRRRIME